MVKYPLERVVSYRFLALIVLIIFYGIYFTKMFLQRKKGIRTNQIGTRKEGEIHKVEMLMSFATVAVVIVQIVSILFNINSMPSGARFAGFLVGMLGDCIFLISILFMKDSWRAGIPEKDKTKLVTNGIYAFSRNPAFLAFDLMYIGMLLMYFNIFMLVFTVLTVVTLHFQILQEEIYLEKNFGEEYKEYRKRVFRYLGRK